MILDNIWYVAATWMGLAFVASLISIRAGISIALGEIVVGHRDPSELRGRLLGETADRITNHAQCSVLVVKI